MFHIFDIFPIIFLTLGPIKTIPVFYRLTQGTTPQFRARLALRGTLIATAMCVLIGSIGEIILTNWRVSSQALQITGGFILLRHALKIVEKSNPDSSSNHSHSPSSNLNLAFSPLAAPTIITPYGVVAILFFMIETNGYPLMRLQITVLVLAMMLLNYIAMLYADKFMKLVGVSLLMLIGWILAVMQGALGIQFIINALRNMGIIPRII